LLERKTIPTQKHFNALFETLKKPSSLHMSPKDLLKYQKVTEIIDIFKLFCYNLTYDDVMNATKHFVYINKLYTYDIPLDNDFFKLFYENFINNRLIAQYPNFLMEEPDVSQNKLKWLQFKCLKCDVYFMTHGIKKLDLNQILGN
jgi:hypothetical protein